MRVKAEHWSIFLDFAEQHSALITNRAEHIAGRNNLNALWQTVANSLNSLGFGEKSVNEWKRAITDWKSKTKAKATKIRTEQEGTGPSHSVPLNELEERLLSLMGRKAIEGDNVVELGLALPGSSNQINVPPTLPAGLEDHIYSHSQQLEESAEETPRQKRSLASNSSGPRKRRRFQASVANNSNELIQLSRETLSTLCEIKEDIRSVADSLKIIANVLQSAYNK